MQGNCLTQLTAHMLITSKNYFQSIVWTNTGDFTVGLSLGGDCSVRGCFPEGWELLTPFCQVLSLACHGLAV